MSYNKWLIRSLAIGMLTACTESRPLPAGISGSYNCKDLADPSRGFMIDTVIRLKDIENPPYTQTGISKGYPGLRWKDYELHRANINYYPHQRNPDASSTQGPFKYENIDVEYEDNRLILKIPELAGLPACEIRFDKDGKVGEHKCNFEKSDLGHRAETFNVECQTSPGKERHYTAEEL